MPLPKIFKKDSLFFAGMIFSLLIVAFIFLDAGRKLEIYLFDAPSRPISQEEVHSSHLGAGATFTLLMGYIHEKFTEPLPAFILQIIIVLAFSRLAGHFFRRINQPSVMGEILAGILLGPSLLGHFSPEMFQFLFPKQTLGGLYILSQIGLVLFMFIIGMELDIGLIAKSARVAVSISFSGIATPFTMGIALAYFLYNNILVPPNTRFLFFALFMGISMSVTAFPVLARILQEKNLSGSELGTIALTCAAVDDVAAWSILAIIVAIIKSGGIIASLFTLASSVVYILIMILLVRPLLKRLGQIYNTKESLTKGIVAGIFIYLFVSSLITEIIGIHPLFGAFLAGAIMPGDHHLKHFFTEKIEDISIVIFLPLFFAFTGLRTEIGLLNDPYLWKICAIVIIVAIAGKFLGTAIPSRISGLSWENSLSIGILMNTRGLMELVALNIGYDIGILSPQMFTILVLMAIITTYMTGPALGMIQKFFADRKKMEELGSKKLTFLLAFARPETATRILQLISHLLENKKDVDIHCIHLSRNDIISEKTALLKLKKMFTRIKKEALKYGLNIKTDYRFTGDITNEISEYGKLIQADILLTGGSQSLFSRSHIGGKIKSISEKSDCTNGVLLDNGYANFENYVILQHSKREFSILKFLQNKFKVTKNPLRIYVIDEYLKKTKKAEEEKLANFIFDDIDPVNIIVMDKAVWIKLEMDSISDLKHSFLLVELKKVN